MPSATTWPAPHGEPQTPWFTGTPSPPDAQRRTPAIFSGAAPASIAALNVELSPDCDALQGERHRNDPLR